MRRIFFAISTVLLGAACGGAERPASPTKHASVLADIASGAAPKTPPREDPSLLARAAIFGNPDRALPSISPDGKRLAWLSNVDGVLNVWVAPASDPTAAKPVTHDKKRGIRSYRWAFTNEHLVYLQDLDGDENWHVHAVDLKTNEDKDLTPILGAQARLEALSDKVPNEILVGVNDRDKRYHDVWRVDVRTGKKTLVQKNDGYASFHADNDLKIRFAVKPEKSGESQLVAVNGETMTPGYARIPFEDGLTTELRGFDGTGKKAWIVDSRGRNTAALVELDIATKETKVIIDDGQADVDDVVVHPQKHTVQAALASYDRLRWHILDPAFRKDFEALEKNLEAQGMTGGDIRLTSRTLADDKWVVNVSVSDGPLRTFLHERAPKGAWKTTFLFSASKALDEAKGKLAKMHPVVVKSRDGLDLVSYLTLPKESDADGNARPDKGPLPMVLFVHGGPWGRDEYGWNANHQWLASRGYAVLSVNYRGSTGFGKAFVNAADREWAGKMHDDLLDATTWAVQEKIADKQRIAIMGRSYGGYATLVGLTFTPETFACGVDIVGPSNLVTLLQSFPVYWEAEVDMFAKRIGDHRTDEGKKLLLSRSPIGSVDKIKKPLLIIQGANDPRVKQAESDQIVKAMQAKHIPVTYLLYPDEGHSFARPESRTSYSAVSEIFLAQCLGGPYQPIGQDFRGASVTVPAGQEHVQGLAEALSR